MHYPLAVRLLAILLLSGALGLPSSSLAKDATNEAITIGTGSVTGVYYPAGGSICRLVNRGRKEHGIRCYVDPTAGSIYNINALRDGDINFGIVQSDWQYKAYHGYPVFADKQPFTNLRSVFSLHSEMFTLAVTKESNIKTFADLKGKRVDIGDAGSGMRATMQELMSLHHWTTATFAKISELKPAEAVQALCAKKIDAMVFTAGHPNGLIQEITANCGAKLIPVEGKEVDTLLANNPYYTPSAIPGGMYKGNPQNISTFGVKSTLVTTAEMSDDLVYELTRSVFDNFNNFKTLHFVFSTLDRERMASAGLTAPLHPGALRYYREVGLLPAETK
jgi:TRAP transporter TAXI family solute receptor